MLTVTVSEVPGESSAKSVQISPQSAAALPPSFNDSQPGTTVAVENDSPNDIATALWDGTNLTLGFDSGTPVQIERLVVGEQELTAEQAGCTPVDTAASSVVCSLAAWPSVVVAITSAKTLDQ